MVKNVEVRFKSYYWLWVCVGFLLLTAYLGTRSLNTKIIWYDEWWSIYISGGAHYGPLAPNEILNRVIQGQVWPPGYYFLLAGWNILAGSSPFAGRALSLLIGILAWVWNYRLARDLFSTRAGLGAAVALGTSAFFISYLYELRGYTLYALLIPLTVCLYWRIITPKFHAGWKTQILFLAGAAGLFYSHYMGALVVAAIAFYHVFFAPKNAIWRRVSLLIGIAVMAFIPWLGAVLSAVQSGSGDFSRNFYVHTPEIVLQKFLTHCSNSAVVLIAIFSWCAARNRSRSTRFLWLILIAALLILGFNTLMLFISDLPYLMALWPLLAIAIGGINYMSKEGLRPIILVSVWVISGFVLIFDSSYQDPEGIVTRLPWDKAAQVMQTYSHPGDTLIFYLPAALPSWIHKPVAEYYLHGIPIQAEVVDSPVDKAESVYRQEAEQFVTDTDLLWIMRQPDDPPSPIVDTEFNRILDERNYQLCGSFYQDSDLSLSLYIHQHSDNQSIHVQFGDDIHLSLITPIEPNVSQKILVLLQWSVSENVPQGIYAVGLHIVDANNSVVRQKDYNLPRGQTACNPTYLSTADLPTGNYTLKITVYKWQETDGMPGSASDDRHVSLGTFSVQDP